MSILYKRSKKIIELLNIDWQYPVITELKVYSEQRNNPLYLGLPWATIIDKRMNIQYIHNIISRVIGHNVNNPQYITCCQHIDYKHLIPLFTAIGVSKLYISHKIIGLDTLKNIKLYPLPLYAVNIEHTGRNTLYKTLTSYTSETPHTKLLHKRRDYLYCFMGAYNKQWYLTHIRDKIFNLPKQENVFINDTNTWHFENIVYGKQVGKRQFNEKEEKKNNIKLNIYNTILSTSRFSLCPSGTGPNSIRFWESLAFGSIPVLLADTLELPIHPLWEQAIIRVKEYKINDINTILSNISLQKENSMRKNCLIIYDDFKGSFIH